MNFLDGIISYIAPIWGLKRQKARSSIELARKYEAASTSDRTKGWITSSSSADYEIVPALLRLIFRSRDLIRNNPYALKGRRAIVSHVIGSGITGEPEEPALKEHWKEWAESMSCDFDDHNDFYGLQTIATTTIVESGSCLVRRIWREPDENNPIPLQIQLLEPDHIDFQLTKNLPDGGYIKQGIEFDKDGKKIAYWIFKEHPGEKGIILNKSWKSIRVPKEDIKHIFFKERPGQNHGVPWLSVIAILLRDFAEFEDAQLVRQKIAACYAAFVRDLEMPENIGGERKLIEKISPGRIEILPPGKDIVFANPPGVDGNGEFIKSLKQAIASGLGITYENLTSDLSNVNFSSARIGQQQENRMVEQWRWQMIIPEFCDTVWAWFYIACEVAGIIGYKKKPGRIEWTPPKREFIDPIKEVDAMKNAVRAGFKTQSEAIRECGYDPERFFEEYANDLKRLDELGIKLDTDPRNPLKESVKQKEDEESKPDKKGNENVS